MSQKTQRKKPRKPKKFRSQFVAEFLIRTYKPAKIADVGGGKGLLAYLLQESGWDTTVIDPFWQELPYKYKSLDGERVFIEDKQSVKRITQRFDPEMVKDFDLLIGLHMHGANMNVIKKCAEYGKDFLLLPCCVIDEPIVKEHGIDWARSLFEYAQGFDLHPKSIRFNFVGKNNAIFTDTNLETLDTSRDISDLILLESVY